MKKKIYARERQNLQRGVGNSVWADRSGRGGVVSSWKNFDGGERGEVKNEALWVTRPSGAQTNSL